jgi:hypothetical protein
MEPVQNQPGLTNQTPPAGSPPPGKPPVQPITQVTPTSKGGKGMLNKVLLLSGPLFLLVSLGVSVYLVKQPPGALELRGRASETAPVSGEEGVKEMLRNTPLNPTSAVAVCQSTNEVLQSGKPTDCADPLFTWSGEQAREPGTKITGYYVYFGEKSDDSPLAYQASKEERDLVIKPIIEGDRLTENQFAPTDLAKGKTYHLAVTAVSDSQSPLWQMGLSNPDPENLSAQAAEILFVYQYE